MRLSRSPDDLFALVSATSDRTTLPAAHIEKDFWVMEVLRSISQPFDGGTVVFKGGTSLSKAFGLIERFSEDIDILLVPDSGSGKGRVDRVLKSLCQRVEVDLGVEGELAGSTHGVKRNVRYPFPVAYSSADVTEGVLLEMGVRGGSEPSSTRVLRSYVADYALGIGQPEDAYQEFAPVELLVLRPERTLVEKLALTHDLAVRHETAGGWIPGHGRHIYDIYCLLGNSDVRRVLEEPSFVARIADDRGRRCDQYGLAWTPRPDGGFAASPLYDPGHASQAAWRAAYESAMSLVWGNRPSWDECRQRVRKYAHLL